MTSENANLWWFKKSADSDRIADPVGRFDITRTAAPPIERWRLIDRKGGAVHAFHSLAELKRKVAEILESEAS